MDIKLLLVGRRKPGMSFDDFKTYLETKHVPLLRELAGDTFPTQHRRLYTDHEATAGLAVISPDLNLPNHDVIAELTFRDMDHFMKYGRIRSEPAMKKRLMEDEAQFSDVTNFSINIVTDVAETNTSS